MRNFENYEIGILLIQQEWSDYVCKILVQMIMELQLQYAIDDSQPFLHIITRVYMCSSTCQRHRHTFTHIHAHKLLQPWLRG